MGEIMNKNFKIYEETEEKFFISCKKIFGTSIMLYCVTGSLARKEIILNWSDIDILLVFNTDYTENFWDKFKTLMKNKYEIKVGCTFYSLQEFKSDLYKDPKTLLSLNSIKAKKYIPRILSPKINLEEIDLSKVKYFDVADFTKFNHDIKREILKHPNYDEKKIIKVMYAMLKIMIRHIEPLALGYDDTKRIFKEKYSYDGLIIHPEDILDNKIPFAERYVSYCNFINWLNGLQFTNI